MPGSKSKSGGSSPPKKATVTVTTVTSTPTKAKKQKNKSGGNGGVFMTPAVRPSTLVSRGASLATTMRRSGGMLSLSFDRAPPHDEFPEGGCRISGVLPGGTSTGEVTNDTAKVGGFAPASGICASIVTPCGAGTSNQVTLFSATSVLALFSQYFRSFRCRFLGVEYTSEISPADTTYSKKIVQMSYERDPFVADGLAVTYTLDTAVTTTQCHRWSAWEPEVVVPLITSGSPMRDDKLFYISKPSTIASTAAELRQAAQGSVTCVINAVGGAQTELGRLLWHFTFDLYGFTNTIAGQPALMVPRPLTALTADARVACSSRTEGESHDEAPKPSPTSRAALQSEMAALRDRLLAMETGFEKL